MALISMDNRFMRFMDRFVDLAFLNLIWIVACIPLITIGPATAAACSVMLKMVDDEEGEIFKPFIKAFKENFKKGVILWLFNAVAFYALYLDFQLIVKSDDPSFIIILVGILSAVFVFAGFVYSWPQLARYDNKLINIFHNSLRICMRSPLRTLLIAAVIAVEIFLLNFNLLMRIFGLVIGPMLILYTICGIAKPIFLEIERNAGPNGI